MTGIRRREDAERAPMDPAAGAGADAGSGSGRISKATGELDALRRRAVDYYRENEVPSRLEELLNSTFYLQPPDVYGHLANCFAELAKPPTICRMIGRQVLDGIGQPTLQVEIFCTVQNYEKSISVTTTTSHLEVLDHAAPELMLTMERERNEAIITALRWVNEPLNEMLLGLQPTDQYKVDKLLGKYFKKQAQEDKESREQEKAEENALSPVLEPSLVPVLPLAKKKGNKPGKKEPSPEKPIPPAEPIEPVLSGSMAIATVSLAVAKTSAALKNSPLYFYIASLKHNQELPKELVMPLLMVTLLNCGKSSAGKLNLMKEVICIPHPGLTAKQGLTMLLEIQKHIMKLLDLPSSPQKTENKKQARDGSKKSLQEATGKMSHLGCLTMGYDMPDQPLLLLQGICINLGLELGTNLNLAINCAAHELMDYSKGKYEVTVGTFKNPDEMVDMYVDLINRFPSITALIDPLRKEDSEQWKSLCNALGSKCHIIAETASKSISKLREEQTINTPKSSGLVLKYTNAATVCGLVDVTKLIESQRHITILGSSDGETSDDSLADLAVGVGARFIKLGGLSRGERVTKYNRLLAIEEELARSSTLAFSEEQVFVDFNEDKETAVEILDSPPAVQTKSLNDDASNIPTAAPDDR
ncbi:enolase 4 [Tachyglossus aculeatus]|uniref:enolase 4 n=1 Tax=Tachyglossus aculeatus TaxID=9261 RepID=UPI0018F3441E|nr:enolase 4 [Tachyglossus aculeatus]